MSAHLSALLAFARARAQRLRSVFLNIVLLCILYYLAWRFLEWPNLPGLVITFGSYPWSWPWLEFGMRAGMLPWTTRDAITLAFISVGFALNGAIAYTIAAWLWHRRRSR